MQINTRPQQNLGFGMSASSVKPAIIKVRDAALETTAFVVDKTLNTPLQKTVPPSLEALCEGAHKTSNVVGKIFVDIPVGILEGITGGIEKVARRILYGRE